MTSEWKRRTSITISEFKTPCRGLTKGLCFKWMQQIMPFDAFASLKFAFILFLIDGNIPVHYTHIYCNKPWRWRSKHLGWQHPFGHRPWSLAAGVTSHACSGKTKNWRNSDRIPTYVLWNRNKLTSIFQHYPMPLGISIIIDSGKLIIYYSKLYLDNSYFAK